MLIRMSDVKSIETNDDQKLYQHQMLLTEDKFKLQSIEVDQEDDQKVDQDLIQIQNLNQKLIIIINSYILVTLIRSTHEKLYAICMK